MERNNIYASNITPRQQEIVYWISIFTLLTKKQVQLLLNNKDHKWVSVFVANLKILGYIQEIPFKENNAKIFCLEPKGIQLAQKLFAIQTKKRLSVKNISLLAIDRYLRIADIYLQLRKDTKKDSLTFFTPITFPYDLFSISPDAYFTHDNLAYFVELDRETQSLATWKKKFTKYAEYYYSNHWKNFTSDFPAICVISLTEQRVEALAHLVEELFNTTKFAPILFKFTTFKELLSQSGSTNICKVPFKKEKYAFS